jgi:hypothetical protein
MVGSLLIGLAGAGNGVGRSVGELVGRRVGDLAGERLGGFVFGGRVGHYFVFGRRLGDLEVSKKTWRSYRKKKSGIL